MLLIVGNLHRGLVAVHCCIVVFIFVMFVLCCVVSFVWQSNGSAIEVCHAVSLFYAVMLHIDVHVTAVWMICCDFLGLSMFFSVQSNGGKIELCHAVTSFCTVRLHANVHAVWTICCDVVQEVR